MTVLPFRETKPRQAALHQGPYYGHALRKILNVAPPLSRGDRLVIWLSNQPHRLWAFWAIVAIACCAVGMLCAL